jgi:hypothetical protein
MTTKSLVLQQHFALIEKAWTEIGLVPVKGFF